MHPCNRLINVEGEITENDELTPEIKKISVKLNKFFSFSPGQYVMLSYEGSKVKKPFSISGSGNPESLTFGILKKGEFTKKLCGLCPGEKINIEGPYGRFVLPKEDIGIAMVAGGIGITPIRCMLLDYINSDRKSRLYLFYSAKTKEDMAYFEELSTLKDDRVEVSLYFTREKTETYHSGRILPEEILAKREFVSRYYVCGPAEMISSLRESIEKQGVAKENIISEEFV